MALHRQDFARPFGAVDRFEGRLVLKRNPVRRRGEDRPHVAVPMIIGDHLERAPEIIRLAIALDDMELEGHFRAFGQGLVFGAGCVDRTFVSDHRMRGVIQILEENLPVRALLDAEHAARHLDLALGGPIAEIVDREADAAQKLFERRAVFGQTGKNEAAIGCVAGDACYRIFRIAGVQPRIFISFACGNR